ncbi:MAG: hypothetical protein ABI679_05200 [Gemmatimonadota bacterium]
MRPQIIALSLAALALPGCRKTGDGAYEVDKPVAGTRKDTIVVDEPVLGTEKDTIHTPTVEVGTTKDTVVITRPKVTIHKPDTNQ